MYSSIFRKRSRTFSDFLDPSKTFSEILRSRLFYRTMGGGPRTFPGGLNKWQWKRLHEKKAREKEKKLLDQEKQLYQARIRSEIRSKLAGKPDPESVPSSTTGHGPMSPQDHIKALADRFMKEGAEDLWNEDDGPLKSRSNEGTGSIGQIRRSESITSPVDLRKLISDNRNLASNRQNMDSTQVNYNNVKSRNYSTHSPSRFRRNESSGSRSNSAKPFLRKLENRESLNSRSVSDFIKNRTISGQNRMRFHRNNSSSSEDESDLDLEDDSAKPSLKVGSSAALGKYDMKIKRRVPLNNLEKECGDFLKQVELIRHELLNRKNLTGNEGKLSEEESILSQKRFDECGISPLTVKALSSAGYVQMTRVQEAAISICLEGKDALVKAKTGTGKSAAFLLPAIEAVLKATSGNTTQRVPPIYVLILCPTRELASQIAAEANVLLKYHDVISLQTLIGGTRFKVDQKRLESEPCQIIVATPGRLLDHIESKSGLSVRLMGLKMLILDEADHLLDLGFRKDMEKIVDCLPRQRQSLLFSATIPKEVRRISQLVLKREHTYIDTIGLGCVETHAKVRQSYLVAPHGQHFEIVHHLLKEHVSQVLDYKVIVFCTTAMVTSLLFLLLREMKMNVREIHSRKPQLYRTRISEEFRESKRLILIASDVSARGMNYPDVTLVVQVGIPSDRGHYIHRLGRTGREGKEGAGILLLAPWEDYFLGEIKDLPLEKFPLPCLDPDIKLKITQWKRLILASKKQHTTLGLGTITPSGK